MSIYLEPVSKTKTSKAIILLVVAIFATSTGMPKVVKTSSEPQNVAYSKENKEEQLNKTTNSFPKSGERKPLRTQWTVATAYSSEVAQTDGSPCIPAMSTFNLCKEYKEHKVADTIAANFLPLGAKVKFPNLYGNKVFTVRDRMNARYNGTNRIDFWKPKKNEAVNFGVKSLKMEILKY